MTERLGEFLVKDGMITEEELAHGLERQLTVGGRIGTNLIELGYLSEEELAGSLSRKLNIPFARPKDFDQIDPEVIGLISRELAVKYNIIPLRKEKNILHITMLDPTDLDAINEIGFMTNCVIKTSIAAEARIQFALEKYYQVGRQLRYISIIDEERKKLTAEKSTEKKRPAPEELDTYLKTAKEDLLQAKEREEIIAILMKNAGLVLDRSIIFIVKKGVVSGWRAYPPHTEKEVLKDLEIRLDQPSIFLDVVESKGPYSGPLIANQGNQILLKRIGDRFPREVIAIPILIKDQVVAILYGDNIKSGKGISEIDFIKKLAWAASISLEILLIRKKLMAI
ncbi:MAG TPA: hypothetical protein VI584_05365 [Nitrospiria bacterium]|nr:hypothetical protein [Nitrospiria bacterium]